MEKLSILCYDYKKVEIGVKMMENRKLNKILLIVIAVSLLGILTTSILTSPNLFKGIFNESSSTETIISSDSGYGSENGDASSDSTVPESSTDESATQNSSNQESSSSKSSSSSSSKENQTKKDLNAKYDLNTVTLEQLMTVPNVGEVKAKAILDLRTKLGKFTSVSQLKSVKGIGSKTYEKLKNYFYV